MSRGRRARRCIVLVLTLTALVLVHACARGRVVPSVRVHGCVLVFKCMTQRCALHASVVGSRGQPQVLCCAIDVAGRGDRSKRTLPEGR